MATYRYVYDREVVEQCKGYNRMRDKCLEIQIFFDSVTIKHEGDFEFGVALDIMNHTYLHNNLIIHLKCCFKKVGFCYENREMVEDLASTIIKLHNNLSKKK